MLTSSSTITLDLIAPKDEKKKMIIMRVFIAFFIVLSAVIAIIQAKSNVVFIAQLMGVSWGALAGAFLAPFLYGLFWKRATKAGCWASFAFGVALSITQLVVSLTKFKFGVAFLDNLLFKSSIHSGAFAMLLGLVIVPLVSVLSKRPDQKRVDGIFACYDKTVAVPVVEALGE